MELEYKVRRGNVSLKVTKQEADKYFDLGYNVYTLDGVLVKEAVPQDVPTLQKAWVDNKAKITELEEEIMNLNDQIAELLAKPKATTKKTSKKSAE